MSEMDIVSGKTGAPAQAGEIEGNAYDALRHQYMNMTDAQIGPVLGVNDRAYLDGKPHTGMDLESCKAFRIDMSDSLLSQPGQSKGKIYSQFLDSLSLAHKTNLTLDEIRQDKQSPCFTADEKKMLDLTDKHFTQLTHLAPKSEQTTDINGLDNWQIHETYPKAKQINPEFNSTFAERAGWTGAAVGAAGEVAAFVYAFPAAMMMSIYGGAAVGIGATVVTGNPIDGVMAAGATSAAWGPLIGGLSGYAIGKAAAEPYWQMTQGRQNNKLFKDITAQVPSYDDYKAGLLR